MGKTVFGQHRRERIAFLAEFTKPGPVRSKVGPGRSKARHFVEKGAKLGWAKVCLDRTGASGSPFSRSYENHRKAAGNHIKAEGKA